MKPVRWLFLFAVIAIIGLVLAVILGPFLNNRLADVGTYIYGVSTAVLAFAAVAGGTLTVVQYFNQRQRELEQRQREQEGRDRDARIELVRLQGELVRLLREQCLRTEDASEKGLLAAEMEKEEHIYEGMVRGLLRGRDLAGTARAAVLTALEEATREMERLRRESEQ